MERSACRACGDQHPAAPDRCERGDAEVRNLKIAVGSVVVMVLLLVGGIRLSAAGDDTSPKPRAVECTSDLAGTGEVEPIDCVGPPSR